MSVRSVSARGWGAVAGRIVPKAMQRWVMEDSPKDSQLESRAIVAKMFGNSVLTFADQEVVSAVNFLTGVIIGRSCSADQFGLFMLGFSIAYVFIMDLQHSLVTSPYTVYSPRLAGSEAARYTGSTLVHALGLGVTAAAILAVGAVGAKYIVVLRAFRSVLGALAAALALILLKEYARRVSLAQLKPRAALMVDLTAGLLQVGGLVLLAHGGGLTAATAYVAVGIACFFPAMGWVLHVRGRLKVRWRSVLPDLSRNWSLGRWMCATTIADMASVQVYPWILAAVYGPATVGAFGACKGAILIANPVLLGLANVIYPKISHTYAAGGMAGVGRSVSLWTALIAGCMLPFCAGLLAFGGWVVAAMYGGKYGGQGGVVALLALGLLVQSLAMPVSCALCSVERPDLIFKSFLLAAVLTACAGVPLTVLHGPAGAAAGMGLSSTGTGVYRIICFRRLRRRTLPRSGSLSGGRG